MPYLAENFLLQSLTAKEAEDILPYGELVIEPGSFRVSFEVDKRVHSLKAAISPVSESFWINFSRELMSDPYLYGSILRRNFDQAHLELAKQLGLDLLADSFAFVEVVHDGQLLVQHELASAESVLLRNQDDRLRYSLLARAFQELANSIRSDLSTVLLLHHSSLDDLILRIRTLRELERREASSSGLRAVFVGMNQESASKFWDLAADVQQLSYDLKADELPASVFRSFGPLPLGGLEEALDGYFEEAYAKVARLAQSFAISLTRL